MVHSTPPATQTDHDQLGNGKLVDCPPMKFRTLLVVALLATAAAAVTSWRLRASAYTKPPAAPGTWHPIVRHQ